MADANIKWIIELKQQFIERPSHIEPENEERRRLLKQWTRLLILKNTLFG